jgi:hypothetical protein
MALRRIIAQTNFDSVLDPAQPGRPAQLRIRLKILLLPRDPSVPRDPSGTVFHTHLANATKDIRRGRVPDGNGLPFNCRSWLTWEFNAFTIRFKRMVELVWNNQMILLPPEEIENGDGLNDHDYRQFVSSPTVPAHVRCVLEVIPVTAMVSTGFHAPIEVVHLDGPKIAAFRNLQRLLTNESLEFEVNPDHRWPNTAIAQVAAAHEVGHWLGNPVPITDPNRYLSHVDAAVCARLPGHERNDDCEYGRVAGRRVAIMGAGSVATDYEAAVWLTRIRRHTRALFGWKWIHRVRFNRGEAPVSERQRRLASAGKSARP